MMLVNIILDFIVLLLLKLCLFLGKSVWAVAMNAAKLEARCKGRRPWAKTIFMSVRNLRTAIRLLRLNDWMRIFYDRWKTNANV